MHEMQKLAGKGTISKVARSESGRSCVFKKSKVKQEEAYDN
jgi:hypothetical protein